MSRLALLQTTMAETYGRLRSRLEGLTDDEFFWQPIAGCWTIYLDPGGHWTYHYAIPEPVPAPVTTLGWQLVHVATCKVMYHEWAYGAAMLTWPELEIPHTAARAIGLLDEGHAMLQHDLDSLKESDLDALRKTNWGELWPAWRIFWVLVDHDALHGGVIGYLRDLYRETARRATC